MAHQIKVETHKRGMTVEVPRELYARLVAAARAERRSVRMVMQMALEAYIAAAETEPRSRGAWVGGKR